MSFLAETVSIPVWLLLLMLVAMIPFGMKVYKWARRFRQGNFSAQNDSDMLYWDVKTKRPSKSAKNSVPDPVKEKSREKKDELVKVLKVLLKEGERGVLMQTIADRMQMSVSKAQKAMAQLVETKMVDEVVGVSGTKFYLTKEGREYCRRKAR